MSVKAFDLAPAVDLQNFISDKTKAQIVCVECCGKNLYIGTEDCFIIQFLIEERTQPGGKIVYHSQKQDHKYLALKKPIVQLRAASALNRILVLCDNTINLLHMFNLEPVVTGVKVRGVHAFCLNENPTHTNPFAVEICVARKKGISIYTVTEDKITPLKDVALTEMPVTINMDGRFVCVALQTQYKMINFETGNQQELFPFDLEMVKPSVTKISREEFLLNGPSSLGMFANITGISQRPPLQWSDNICTVTFVHPYILALNDEFITVHSILDQQQKQSIPFQGGVVLGEFDGRIFVASHRNIYALVPIPIEKQIQALLTDQRVTEALELAKNAKKTGLSRESFQRMYHRIQQQAGFIEFQQLEFEKASELFKSGHLDVRELMCLYPGLLPINTDFVRSVPPLHEIADINQLCMREKDKVIHFKDFLMQYLEDIRGTSLAVGCQKEIDTALLKLYAETDSPELETLIVSDTACDITDCIQCLENYKRYHAQGLLYRYQGEVDKALPVWTKLAKGELVDEKFPGLKFLVEFLSNLSNHDLVWQYVDWVLEQDEELAVKVFTDRPPGEPITEKMRPEAVVDFLSRYSKAVTLYLEHLVFTKKLEREKFHTHLAVLYLDAVLKIQQQEHKPNDNLEEYQARAKLQHMLQESNLYRVQLLLGKVKETKLYPECAILYGKLEEHDKALRILVHQLRDFTAAEEYCVKNSKGKDLEHRKRLFHVLLSVYMDPTYNRRNSLVGPAVSLLNNNKADFDTLKVLQMLPENWSIGLISKFLTSSVRKSVNGNRNKRIERMLARGENIQIKSECINLTRHSVQLEEERMCPVCERGFTEPNFVRYPNGVITHTHCAHNKYVCPITGKVFETTRPTSHPVNQSAASTKLKLPNQFKSPPTSASPRTSTPPTAKRSEVSPTKDRSKTSPISQRSKTTPTSQQRKGSPISQRSQTAPVSPGSETWSISELSQTAPAALRTETSSMAHRSKSSPVSQRSKTSPASQRSKTSPSHSTNASNSNATVPIQTKALSSANAHKQPVSTKPTASTYHTTKTPSQPKKTIPGPPKSSLDPSNPFADSESDNPFTDSSNPFGDDHDDDHSFDASNPFADSEESTNPFGDSEDSTNPFSSPQHSSSKQRIG